MVLDAPRRIFCSASWGSREVLEGMRITTTNSREDPETSSDSTSTAFAVKFRAELLLKKKKAINIK